MNLKRLETLKLKAPIGTVFDRLTVIGYEMKYGAWHLRCRCACGGVRLFRRDNLVRRRIQSCGCKIAERLRTYGIHKRLPPGVSQLNSLFSRHSFHVAAKKIISQLTKNQFKRLITSACHYCGAAPSAEFRQTYTNGTFMYTGIDRLDSDKGYTKSNSVPCCKLCNFAKNRMTVDEFKTWLRRCATHFLGMK
jgi:hypothetical protein